MMPPRAQLSSLTLGFIVANVSLFSMPRVSSVIGICTVMKSAAV